jgi:dipeptide/tripeptide permease
VLTRLEAADSRERLSAAIFALLLGSFFFWWAWKAGAYFGTVFFPGAIAVFVLLGMLLVVVPLRTSLSAPLVAILALVGIGVWTAIAMAWSPERSVAVSDAYIALVYAAIFAVGLLAARTLGDRAEAALVPVASVTKVPMPTAVTASATGTRAASARSPRVRAASRPTAKIAA